MPLALARRIANVRGQKFQVSIFTGASTGPELDGALAMAGGIHLRLENNQHLTERILMDKPPSENEIGMPGFLGIPTPGMLSPPTCKSVTSRSSRKRPYTIPSVAQTGDPMTIPLACLMSSRNESVSSSLIPSSSKVSEPWTTRPGCCGSQKPPSEVKVLHHPSLA